MFEVRSELRNIAGRFFTVYSRDVCNDDIILTVSAGSTGLSKDKKVVSYIEFADADAGEISFSTAIEKNECSDKEIAGLIFEGEGSLDTLIRGLEFITQALKDAYNGVDDD